MHLVVEGTLLVGPGKHEEGRKAVVLGKPLSEQFRRRISLRMEKSEHKALPIGYHGRIYYPQSQQALTFQPVSHGNHRA